VSPPQDASRANRSGLSRVAGIITLGFSETPRGRRLLRAGASRLIRLALRIRSRPLRLSEFPRVLVIAPHPDDETFGCGGLIAQLAAEKPSVHVAFVTDGSASHPGHPSVGPRELGDRRTAEARTAADVLGVEGGHLTFLGAKDGTLARLDEPESGEVVRRMAALLGRIVPDAVFLPCRRDGSSEHEAVFDLVMRAVEQSGQRPRVLEYPIWSWWNPLLLLGPLTQSRRVWRANLAAARAVKARAISAYISQTLPLSPDTSAALPDGFAAMFLCREEFLFER
jgi:N-acetylglucosamine malate deacetylase 1